MHRIGFSEREIPHKIIERDSYPEVPHPLIGQHAISPFSIMHSDHRIGERYEIRSKRYHYTILTQTENKLQLFYVFFSVLTYPLTLINYLGDRGEKEEKEIGNSN